MIDKAQDNLNPTSSMNNRILIHNSITDVIPNHKIITLTVQVKPGREKALKRAIQREFKEYELLLLSDKNALHIGVCKDQSGDTNPMVLYRELQDLVISPDKRQPSEIEDFIIVNRLQDIILKLASRAYSDIICLEGDFISGFRWLSRIYRDAMTLINGGQMIFFNLEKLLFVADDLDKLVNLLPQKTVVVTAVCVNEADDRLDSIYPTGPAIITPEIAGDIANSQALGKGDAYYHPTPGYDDFLAYCSWRFHEPIPVEDIRSITEIFKRLSDLGLPPSRFFLELRDTSKDSIFTVFSPEYEKWHEEVWYE